MVTLKPGSDVLYLRGTECAPASFMGHCPLACEKGAVTDASTKVGGVTIVSPDHELDFYEWWGFCMTAAARSCRRMQPTWSHT